MARLPTDVRLVTSDMPNAPTAANQDEVLNMLKVVLSEGFDEKTATSLVVSGNIATLTCAGHGRQRTEVIRISGCDDEALNGDHRVATVTDNSFTFELVGVGDGAKVGDIKFRVAPIGWRVKFESTSPKGLMFESPNPKASLCQYVLEATSGDWFKGVICAGSTSFSQREEEVFLKQNGYLNVKNKPNRKWIVFGDDMFVYIFLSFDYHYPNDQYWCSLFFGDYISVQTNNRYIGCFSLPFYNTNYNNIINIGSSNNHYFEKLRAFNGLKGGVSINTNQTSSGFSSDYDFPNPIDFSLILQGNKPLKENNTFIGTMPGLFFCPQNISGYYSSKIQVYEGVKGAGPYDTLVRMPNTNTNNVFSSLFFSHIKWRE